MKVLNLNLNVLSSECEIYTCIVTLPTLETNYVNLCISSACFYIGSQVGNSLIGRYMYYNKYVYV